NCAFSRTDMIFAPLRTMPLSSSSACQNSSGWNASLAGLKPRNAFSKPGHFWSMTLHANPAQNTRFVISARMRSSGSFASAFASGLAGSNLASPFGPPLRFSALARMVLNGTMRATLFQRRQQPGHQAAALGEAVDDDMLVQRMRIRAANAEPIQRLHAHRAGKIAVRAAAGAAMRQLLADAFGDTLGLFIQRHGAGIRLPDRAGDAARHLEGDVVARSRQRQHLLHALVEIGLALGHAQRFAGAGRGDAIDPLPAMYDADGEGAVRRGHAADGDDLAGHLADRGAAGGQRSTGMARPADGLEVEARDGVTAGDDAVVLAAGFGNQHIFVARRLRLDDVAGGGGADFLIRGEQHGDRQRGGEGGTPELANGLQRQVIAAFHVEDARAKALVAL